MHQFLVVLVDTVDGHPQGVNFMCVGDDITDVRRQTTVAYPDAEVVAIYQLVRID